MVGGSNGAGSTGVVAPAHDARRVAVASAIGTTIEWYDFFIYGTAAAMVFGPQFFPQVSTVAGTLASFATFGVGFVARPLGGIVMGHFGDRVGRKSMLVWSLMLMGVSTFAIGLLPNYAQIGVWAPALLIALRSSQGFALGGEWGGAVLMSVEHAPAERRGFYGSVVALGLPAGIVLSKLVFLVASWRRPDAVLAWGWRVPFLASAVLVAVGLFMRLGLSESPVFAEVRRARTRGACRSSMCCGARRGGAARRRQLRRHQRARLHGARLLRLIRDPCPADLAASTSSRLAARSGPLRRLRRCVRALVGPGRPPPRDAVGQWCARGLVAVFFPLLDTRSVPLIWVALCVMLVAARRVIGTQPAVFAELFPPSLRYSGASLGNTLGTIVGGAPAPFIAATLQDRFGSSNAVGLYITVLAAVSWVCVLGLKETPACSLIWTKRNYAS